MFLVHRGSGTYAYESVRRDGRVTSRYVGSGAGAVMAAEMERVGREERDAAEAERRAEDARLDALDGDVARWSREVDDIARAALLAAGYHQHHRQWRRRRRSMTPQTSGEIQVTSRDTKGILERAQEGDKSTLPVLRAFLAERPDVLAENGDAAYHARNAIVAAYAGENYLLRELLTRELTRLAEELAGPDPGPIERLLAGRAAMCWLAVHWYETLYARSMFKLTLPQIDSHQRRIDRAHRRLLTALKTLALIRRVSVPTVQVAIQTVNVESPAALEATPNHVPRSLPTENPE